MEIKTGHLGHRLQTERMEEETVQMQMVENDQTHKGSGLLDNGITIKSICIAPFIHMLQLKVLYIKLYLTGPGL